MLPLILASSSPYRRQLLARLGLEFTGIKPAVDESARPGEGIEALVSRLALDKALAVASSHPAHLIIGSDQLASLQGRIIGKPGNHQAARAQLSQCSGKQLNFHTGLCLLNSQTGNYQLSVETFTVHLRQLSEEQIERYLQAERPYNCAGSFKMEGLGIALFEKLSGNDPNTLIGLPLIRLVSLLANEGVIVP